MKGKSLSHVRLFATPWTAAHQAPPSMGLSRQEYWSGVPLPSPKITYVYIKMYTALLLVIAKNWKWPPCPSTGEQKNKPWYNRILFILFSIRKKWAIQLQKRHKGNVNVYQVKSEIWKNYLLYNSNYMITWKSQDYRDSKKVSGCPVFGRGGVWSTGEFWEQWNFCMIL